MDVYGCVDTRYGCVDTRCDQVMHADVLQTRGSTGEHRQRASNGLLCPDSPVTTVLVGVASWLLP